MNDKKIRKLVLAALLAALVCVATMVVQIPSPMQGYVNLGDCFVLLSGWLLGPWYGFAAGGIGSMLADLFLGYAHYAPGTLVIKGLVALLAALLYEKLGRSPAARIASAFAGQSRCRRTKTPRAGMPPGSIPPQGAQSSGAAQNAPGGHSRAHARSRRASPPA